MCVGPHIPELPHCAYPSTSEESRLAPRTAGQDRILRSPVKAKASASLRDAKGVAHTSPGQRPGFMSPKTILSAESARHRAAVGPPRSIPPLAVIRLRPRRTPLIPYVPLIELQVILLEEVAVLLLEGPCPMMFFLMVNIAHEVF